MPKSLSLFECALPESGQRNLLILGAARSGLAAASLAVSKGWRVWIADDSEVKADLLRRIEEAGAQLWTQLDNFEEVDLLLLSPAVQPSNPFVQAAYARALRVCSEVDFARSYFAGRVVGITGSNGKTTTTLLMTELFKSAGLNAMACGNIGIPFSQIVLDNPECEVAVLELSSYQLEMSQDLDLDAGCLLNVTPDHLARHGSFEAYVDAKLRLLEMLKPHAPLAYNQSDTALVDALQRHFTQKLPAVRGLAFSTLPRDAKKTTPATICEQTLFLGDTPFFSSDHWDLQGQHNLANLAAAVLIAIDFKMEPERLALAASRFQPVPHRIEKVGEHDGVVWINDSKATNLEAALPALQAQRDGSVILLAGGKGKTKDYSAALELILKKVKVMVVFGEDAIVFVDFFGSKLPVELTRTLEEAVRLAHQLARREDTVLLSPMCASFDQFENFEVRGEAFREAVLQLIKADSDSKDRTQPYEDAHA
jgi:UDP-N-acetylmuramoylalanine--D-glutamate ligase